MFENKIIRIAIFFIVAFLSIWTFQLNLKNHHDFFGGADEGTYIGMGKLLSEFHGYIFYDKAFFELNGYVENKRTFLPGPFEYYDSEKGLVKNGWNKGYPLLSVPFWWIFPRTGWKFIAPLFGSMSAFLWFYFLWRMGRRAAAVGMFFLLQSSLLQVWHSRYPLTEIVSQFLLIALLLSVQFYRETKNKKIFYPLISGILLFSIHVHFMNSLYVIPVVVVLFLDLLDIENKKILTKKNLWQATEMALLFGIIPFVFTIVQFFTDPGLRDHYIIDFNRFIGKEGPSEKMPLLISMSFRLGERLHNLLLYVIFPIPVISMIGAQYLVRVDKKNRAMWWGLLSIAAVTMILIVAREKVNTSTLYIARRYVPVILPVIYVFFTLTLDELYNFVKNSGFPQWKVLHQRMISGILGVFLVFLVLSIVRLQIQQLYPFRHVNKGRDLHSMSLDVTEKISKKYEIDRSVVLVDGGPYNQFTGGLRYVLGVPIGNAVYIRDDELVRLIREESDRGRHFYLLSSNHLEDRVANLGFSVKKVRDYPIISQDPNDAGLHEFPSLEISMTKYGFYYVEAHQ